MIKLENVDVMRDSKAIITELSCEFSDGKINFITGTSGCGKTTLLNVVGLIHKEYNGSIKLNGIELKSISDKKRMKLYRTDIGFVFQNFGLIEDLTVKENLLIALKFKKLKRNDKNNEINKIMKKLGLSIDLERKIYELSGGQQQRIALARIILKDSNIILADEPTGSLDQNNARMTMNILRELSNNGKLVIIVTHDTSLIEQGDNWIKLKQMD